MEWRPQKEGIATKNAWRTVKQCKMEWRPQKEGIATPCTLNRFESIQDGMETSKRRDCDNFLIKSSLPI
jgi:hypothetical protein